MLYKDQFYMIFNASDKDLIDYKQVEDTSSKTIRLSVDETRTLVKWKGIDIPSSVAALENTEGPYSHSDILVIMNTEEWIPPISPDK